MNANMPTGRKGLFVIPLFVILAGIYFFLELKLLSASLGVPLSIVRPSPVHDMQFNGVSPDSSRTLLIHVIASITALFVICTSMFASFYCVKAIYKIMGIELPLAHKRTAVNSLVS